MSSPSNTVYIQKLDTTIRHLKTIICERACVNASPRRPVRVDVRLPHAFSSPPRHSRCRPGMGRERERESDSQTIWLPERQKKKIKIYSPETRYRFARDVYDSIEVLKTEEFCARGINLRVIIYTLFVSAIQQPSARHNTSSSPRGFGGRP